MQRKTITSLILIITSAVLVAFTLLKVNYGITSTLVIIASMVPFFMRYESKKPKARDIVPISVMSAVAIVSRLSFAYVPQFKPIIAIIIITAVVFGAESGFICGSVSMFVSNLFFGQGPYTPWQMFCGGIIGLGAGILASKGMLGNRIVLSLYGLATGFLFGSVVDIFTIATYTPQINIQTILGVYIAGFWFNAVLAAATAFFLYTIGPPLIKKLRRIKIKYGIGI